MEVLSQVEKRLRHRLLLFPVPFQGHIAPMFHLANLLYSKGFSITIIQTRYNSIDLNNFPHFTFDFLEDGLPADLRPSGNDYTSVLSALDANCLEPLRDSLSQNLAAAAAEDEPIACLIDDTLWSFTGSVAESFNLPRIALRTSSMSTYIVYHSLPSLVEKGYFPLEEGRLEEPMLEFPPFKVRDLPPKVQHDLVTSIVKVTTSSQGIICNTFEELEAASIARVRKLLPIPIFPIGPFHKHSLHVTASIWAQDHTSISWLNTQAHKSVLYVSFGSMAEMSKAEFLEIACGLANSKQPFLWVIRAWGNQGFEANDVLPEGYSDMVSGRGYIVQWAPQLDVLSHPAVGGFFTHCGWNSVVESICEGVPMLCLPSFADQVMNARQVSEDWGIGLQLGKGATREDIEREVRKLMLEEGKGMRSRITTLKEKASLCLAKGGSSYRSLESLTSYLLSL